MCFRSFRVHLLYFTIFFRLWRTISSSGRVSTSTPLSAAALAVLGYTQQDISAALKGVDVETLPLEEIVRQSLKKMVK